ncbi:MAG: TIGR03016 family PEP-CTERM system-associated outer membrane protein, partial [Bacillota bacterium]
RYDDQRIDYKSAEDVSTRAVSGSLRYLLSPRVALTASAGYEDNSYASIGPEPKGRFWTLGAAWAPSERTSVAASAGRRFFGKTLTLNAQHRTRMTVWSVAYEENLTTTRSQFLVPLAQDTASFLNELWKSSIPDQMARNEQVQQFIRDANLPATVITPVNSFTNRVFLQRSAQASAAWRGAKNTLILSLFHIEREPESVPDADRFLAAGIGALAGEATRQTGVGLQWSRRLGPHTSANAGASYSRVRSLATGRRDNDASATLGVIHQLQQKVHGGVQLRRLEKRSNQPGGEFRENAIAAFLQVNF